MRLITRAMVQADRSVWYVFGDNMQRRGMAGQAGAMRGEPNAIGIPTKWRGARFEDSYLIDADWNIGVLRDAIVGAFDWIEGVLASGHDVVVPEAGIGTGLADLQRRAPRIFAYIQRRLDALG